MGKLVHACGVYAVGTIFYQRLLATLRTSRRKKDVTLRRPALDGIRWWLYLLQHSSGTVPLDPAPWKRESEHRIYTDASGWGWGCCYKGQWMQGPWPPAIRQQAYDQKTLSISDLELVALNIALETWGHALAGQRLNLRCDNTASVANVTAQASSIPRRAALLHRLFVIAAMHGIQIRSTYINTKQNEHAGALSRNDLTRFFSLPQDYPLQRVRSPRLDAFGLLLDPDGPLNPSSLTWAPTPGAPLSAQLQPSRRSPLMRRPPAIQWSSTPQRGRPFRAARSALPGRADPKWRPNRQNGFEDGWCTPYAATHNHQRCHADTGQRRPNLIQAAHSQ